jgi:hypothetical protein
MGVPAKSQLNPTPENLDGQKVVEHLLGKDIEGAVSLLKENSAYFQEDYTWMGAEAFCYYSPALLRYLRSPAARDDYLFAYGMLRTFWHRLDQDGVHIAPAFSVIEEFCSLVEQDAARLGFDDDYAKRTQRRIAEIRAKLEPLKRR